MRKKSRPLTSPTKQIEIPYNYTPRHYQTSLFRNILQTTKKKHILMMSRRLGKTYSVLHLLATAMMTKVGSYLLVLPYQVQARAIVWKGLTNDGIPMLDATFPAELVSSKNNTEMTLTLINGSI